MKQTLQTLLFALIAMMMPIGAWALDYQVEIPNTGITTLYVPFALELPEGVDVRAFIVTDVMTQEDGTVQLVEKEITGGIPALTPVILRGDHTRYTFTVVTSELAAIEDNNLLNGTLVPMSLDVSHETGNFMLCYTEESSEYGLELDDWQAPVNNGSSTYRLGANKAYLDLSGKLEPSKIAELKTLPHLQHTHGGCEICGQVTEVSWGATADALTSYGTLNDAVAGIEDSNIGYIKLLANVEDGIYVEGGNFTLDLNGHTISSEGHTLVIRNQSNVTIVDNSETKSGKVISSGEGSFAVGITNSASVTINGGTYESTHLYALNLENNSSATINGGSYVNSYLPVFIGAGCSATITGGTFIYTENSAIRNDGNLLVKGGTFTYDGEDESYSTINYFNGSIDFSDYPTTEDISSIIVSNQFGMDIVPSAETILLPKGYCFFEVKEGTPVTMLVQNLNYYIGEEPAKYTITFVAGDGEGEMEDVIVYEGDYTLPECAFIAPEGKIFKAWQIGDEEYQPSETVSIEDNTAIKALWTADVPQIIIKMHDSAGDGWHGDAIVVKKNGKEIGTATIEEGADGIVSFDYNETADYAFYWQYTEQDYRYPEECSFEILIDDEEVFAAAIYEDVEAPTSDCGNYVDGELLYSIEGEDVFLENLTIADGQQTEYINDASFTTVETLTYTRTLPNQKWNALYVPFEIPVSELLDNYDVAYINDVHSFDNDDNGEIDDLKMEVIKLTTGTLNANYPYLIRAKSEEAKAMSLELTDATLYATEENMVTCSSVFMKFDVTGTYEQMNTEELNGSLVITTDGSWKQLAKGSTLKPFRLYLTMTALDGSPVKVSEQAARSMRIVTRGESQGTTDIEDSVLRIEHSALVYDLMGRRVLEPQKGGIYIVNGKKVVW